MLIMIASSFVKCFETQVIKCKIIALECVYKGKMHTAWVAKMKCL